MKIVVIFCLIVFCGCTQKWYLPEPDNVGLSPYGAHIKLTNRNFKPIEGELIAVDEDYIYILSDFSFIFSDDYQAVGKVPVNDVYRFKIRYANPDKTGMFILGGAILPMIHVPDPAGSGWSGSGIMPFQGYLSFYVLPINIISILIIQANTYMYNHRNIDIKEIYKFARFPQGLPENIDIKDIKSIIE